MSKNVGRELPDVLMKRLDARNLEAYADRVILVSTVDGDGWPHQAMLSHFEVVARDRRNVRLALYNDSTTTANIRRRGLATLTFVDERMAYYVKTSAEILSGEMRTSRFNVKLNCRVEHVLADEVNEEFEPGAYVASGIRYFHPNRAGGIDAARALLAELLE